jgi:hypothetical protein
MRTPGEILLRQHQAASPKLDDIRAKLVAQIGQPAAPKNGMWREWLWPCPQAWAGLAAAWLIILGMHLATGNTLPRVAAAPHALSRQELLELRQQQQMLANLISPNPNGEPEPPKRLPQPRSERRRILIGA